MSEAALSLELCALGMACADLASIARMRKQLPDWAPADTPGHFLKHADEQTVVAVQAVDQAIKSCQTRLNHKGWSIIAAPRFIGRLAGTATLERYGRGGGPAISPHLIPHHSLHSVSGALSILLSSRKPNLGVGGGADSLTDGLLAALTLLPEDGASGTWLVSTAWNPEPVIDGDGACRNAPACHAVALALRSAAESASFGCLTLAAGHHAATDFGAPATVVELSQALATAARGSQCCQFRWRVPGGATIDLNVHAAAERLPLAA